MTDRLVVLMLALMTYTFGWAIGFYIGRRGRKP